MENKDNGNKEYIQEQANMVLNSAKAKIAAEQWKTDVVPIVSVLKTTYEEAIKQGFSDSKAFDFATKYLLEVTFHNESN